MMKQILIIALTFVSFSLSGQLKISTDTLQGYGVKYTLPTATTVYIQDTVTYGRGAQVVTTSETLDTSEMIALLVLDTLSALGRENVLQTFIDKYTTEKTYWNDRRVELRAVINALKPE